MELNSEMDTERWTCETWYALALEFERASGNPKLPKKLRQQLSDRAEACWTTGDWMRGITPEMWEEECRIYQAEDDAMVARNAELPSIASKPAEQLELVMAR